VESVEIFDPSTRRFHSGGILLQARSGHTATLLPDGRVLLVGGVGTGWTFLSSAELYDPASGRSESVGSMRVPRESHTATLLADGRVMIIGGHSGRRANMQVYASAEVYDPRNRRFEVIGGADRTDRNHFSSTEIYNPVTATFEQGPSMLSRRYKIAGTAVLLPSGDVLVTSGSQSAEVLDRASGAFREIPGRFPDAYRFAAAAPLVGGDVLIAGGYSDGNQNTAGVWRFRRRP
jgi:hypothetical protein